MEKFSRRNAFGALALAGGAIIAKPAIANIPLPPPEPPPRPKPFAANHIPRPLPFDAKSLKGISERLIVSHHDNNYVGAINALNGLEKRLLDAMAIADFPAGIYGDLKRDEVIRTNSKILHELYFQNLGGDGKTNAAIENQIVDSFGSFAAWEAEFRRTAMSLSGGTGWCILALNTHTHSLHNYWCQDHSFHSAIAVPLLVLDMYEHAYQMDYGAAAGRYIDAFFQNINWQIVARRLGVALQFEMAYAAIQP